MAVRRYTVTITTDAGGVGSGVSSPVSGSIRQISYIKTDFADGVDFTITSTTTGQTIWTESNVNATTHHVPRIPTESPTGTALVFIAAGQSINDAIYLGRDTITIAIAQGGNVKTGVFHIVTES